MFFALVLSLFICSFSISINAMEEANPEKLVEKVAALTLSEAAEEQSETTSYRVSSLYFSLTKQEVERVLEILARREAIMRKCYILTCIMTTKVNNLATQEKYTQNVVKLFSIEQKKYSESSEKVKKLIQAIEIQSSVESETKVNYEVASEYLTARILMQEEEKTQKKSGKSGKYRRSQFKERLIKNLEKQISSLSKMYLFHLTPETLEYKRLYANHYKQIIKKLTSPFHEHINELFELDRILFGETTETKNLVILLFYFIRFCQFNLSAKQYIEQSINDYKKNYLICL